MKHEDESMNRRYGGMIRLSFRAFLLAGVMLTPIAAEAQHHAYVAQQGWDNVSVIDTTTNTVVATIPVGNMPSGIAITPSETYVYVANYFSNTISVIDTTINAVVATIPVADRPFNIAITPNGAFAYVLHVGSWGGFSVIDIATNIVVATVPVESPRGIAFTPDGAFAYVTNVFTDSVSVFDTATNTLVSTVQSVGKFPRGVAITPDGAFAYVVNQVGTVSVIDINLKYVVSTINLAAGVDILEVAITPDGAFAYVPNPTSKNVFVIDTKTNTIFATVEGNDSPGDLAITPDGTFVYVTMVSSNKVSVINTTTNAVVANIEVEFGPLDIAIGGPKLITVAIDIKPGDANNSINPKSNGEIPVAILAKDGLDVSQINPATIRFGKTGEENSLSHYALKDVDKDGDLDLMLYFKTKDAGIQCGDTKAYLKGKMMNGLAIRGSDSVRTVGCK